MTCCQRLQWRYLRMAPLRLFAAAFLVATTWPIAGLSFDSKIMNSVVAVIPASPGRSPRVGTGARSAPEGTAVAIFEGGYLVTNAHVLGRAMKVDIRLADGRLVAVEIVGRDPRTDLALLKAPIEFPVPQIAPTPEIGGRVCAIGNQFGLGLSVTCGVVSALRRTNAGFNPIEDFVQTDATVNPGGSGGALVDSEGRLVGIVSAIFTKNSDADIGVNFATAMGLVRRVVEDIKYYGRLKIGWSGLLMAPLSPEERRKWSGARVDRIIPGSAAELSDLEVGDIVTKIDDRPIILPSDVRAAIFMRRPGDTLLVSYSRGGHDAKTGLTLRASR